MPLAGIANLPAFASDGHSYVFTRCEPTLVTLVACSLFSAWSYRLYKLACSTNGKISIAQLVPLLVPQHGPFVTPPTGNLPNWSWWL